MRETLTAGTAMSTSLNTTLTTFTTLMQRFGVGETNNASPPDTNSRRSASRITPSPPPNWR